MKNIFYILLLLPTIIFAQYPNNSGQKITLGEQTSADGLVWRGRTSDTANLMTNKLDTSVYLVLDTMTKAMWLYRVTTTPKWNRVVDSLNNMQGTLSVAKGGTNASTFMAGSVVFAGSSGTYTQDNSGLFYDNTNDRLGLLTSTPRTILDVKSVKLNSAKLGSGFGVALFENDVTNDDTPDYQAFAIQNTLRYRGTQGTNNTTRGIIANINSAFNYSTGTVEEMSGFYLDLRNLSTGTITNAYGIKIINFENSSGTITNKYGFYSDIANSGATNKWNIYVNGAAPNYFNGNVGIGTISPNYKLDISGTVNTSLLALRSSTNPSSNNYVGIDFGTGNFNGSLPNRSSRILGFADGGNDAIGLSFYTSNAAAPTEKMRIDKSGNVGIGVTPSAWDASAKVLQIGNFVALANYTDYMDLSTNTFYDGQYKYLNSSRAAATYTQTGGQHRFYIAPSGTAGTAITFTQAMTILANGNVGIGTASPGTLLDVKGVGTNLTGNIYYNFFAHNAAGTQGIYLGYDATATVGVIGGGGQSTNGIAFTTGSSFLERMRINGSGNVGIGVTPSAWNGIYRVFQIDGGSISSSPSYNNISVASNVFYNAGNSPRYIVNDYATLYGQDDGLHAWYTAPSGTADAAITFTQAMTLDASGRLGIGTASPSQKLHVNGNGYFTGNITIGGTEQIGRLRLYSANTNLTGLNDLMDGTNTITGYRVQITGTSDADQRIYMGTSTTSAFVLGTNGTPRLRIDGSTGNVGIGTTSPATKLEVATDGGANNITATAYRNDAGQNNWNSRFARGSMATPLIVQNGDAIGSFGFEAHNGTNFNLQTALIFTKVNGTVTTSSIPTDIYFHTDPAGSAYLDANRRMRIASGGAVTINNLGTGPVYSNSGVLSNTPPSDERLKNNITNISWGLNDILKLRPVSFNWKDDRANQGKQFGFIAQEVHSIMPEAIKIFGEDFKYLGLEKDAIYATLVKAVQELSAQVDILKQEIINLKNK